MSFRGSAHYSALRAALRRLRSVQRCGARLPWESPEFLDIYIDFRIIFVNHLKKGIHIPEGRTDTDGRMGLVFLAAPSKQADRAKQRQQTT